MFYVDRFTIIDSISYQFQFWTDGTFTEEKYSSVIEIMHEVRLDTPVPPAEEEKESGLPLWLELFLDLKWAWLTVAVITAVLLFIGTRLAEKSAKNCEVKEAETDEESCDTSYIPSEDNLMKEKSDTSDDLE